LEQAPAGGGASASAAPAAAKPPRAFPSEIVPGFLFLGSSDHASRQEILKTLGIANILNVRRRRCRRVLLLLWC
jgi:dual specificity MAP kinase phosphatase